MTKRKARVSRPVDGLVGRARGYVRHEKVLRRHRLVPTAGGGAYCTRSNCEINQPCDSKSMELFR